MALAHLKYTGSFDGHQQFKADIGSNRYFRIAVGDYQSYRSYGVPLLERRKFTSPLYGPVPESRFGRVKLRIPNHLITRDSSSIQLMSYRDNNENGVAFSQIERVIPTLGRDDLPVIQLSMEKTNINQTIVSVPFQYKETRISNALFFAKLLDALPNILPAIGDLIQKGRKPVPGAIVPTNGAANGANNAASGEIDVKKLLEDPKKLQEILALLKGINGATSDENPETSEQQALPAGIMDLVGQVVGGGASAVAGNGDSGSAGASEGGETAKPKKDKKPLDMDLVGQLIGAVTDGLEKLGKIGQQINKDELDALQKLNPGVDDADVQGLLNQMSVAHYSNAFVDPMMIMNLVKGIIDGLGKLGEIGQKINKDELDALQKLNPGVDDADIQGLLNQMGIMNHHFPSIQYIQSSAVRIEPVDLQTINVEGAEQYLFSYGRQINIPIKLHTPRDIPAGIYQIIVKRKKGGEVLL